MSGDHAAAYIHTHGSRDDGPFGGDYRADRGAYSDVSVGHEGYGQWHNGQTCGPLSLPDSLLVNVLDPPHTKIVQWQPYVHWIGSSSAVMVSVLIGDA